MVNWDKKYTAVTDGLFGMEVNEYVRQISARSDFTAASALCLADGDGRNSRWLANQNLTVTAVDISEAATNIANAHDEAVNVTVERIAADLEMWSPVPPRTWESVFIMYLQAPQNIRLKAIQAGWQSLKPGGWLMIEAFAKTQSSGDMGPNDQDLLYDLSEIESATPGVEIIEAIEGCVRLDEGPRHQGLAHVVRFAGRKPAEKIRV